MWCYWVQSSSLELTVSEQLMLFAAIVSSGVDDSKIALLTSCPNGPFTTGSELWSRESRSNFTSFICWPASLAALETYRTVSISMLIVESFGRRRRRIYLSINKQYNYTKNRNRLTGCREGINPSMLATYDNYTWISNITDKVVQGASAMQTRMLVAIHCGPKNCHTFSFHYSFYKCSPIFMIFGTHFTELICNTTIIDLPTSPMYC